MGITNAIKQRLLLIELILLFILKVLAEFRGESICRLSWKVFADFRGNNYTDCETNKSINLINNSVCLIAYLKKMDLVNS